jgi:hypothetical protein
MLIAYFNYLYKFFSIFNLVQLILNLLCIKFFNLVRDACAFQVCFENKVDLVLVDVPSNLPILHVSEPLSFIPPWNMRMDNFIKSIVFFTDRFLSDRGVTIIMHADDL